MISKKIILFYLILQCIPNHCAIIIFDLDGVLLKKSSFAAFWEIGLSNLIGFYNPFNLESKLFEFLEYVEPRTATTEIIQRNDKLLPPIMCDWLTGKKTNAEICLLITQKIKEQNTIFLTAAESNLIKEIAIMMFSPERLIKAIRHVRAGIKLLKRCYQQRDCSGNRKHRIYLLSNWDAESFLLLAQQHKKFRKILSLCDGFIISGEVGLAKPDPRIFLTLFSEYNVNPDVEITVYVDDQESNIQAAYNLHKKQLYPLLCKNYNFKPIKKKMVELAII